MQPRIPVPLVYAATVRTGRKFHAAMTLTLMTGVLTIWGGSWFVEIEVRCMSAGTHRHLELAKGAVTYVTTSGCQSADYLTWATSPDLSFGRSTDWYSVSDPGEVGRYWRIHSAVTPIAAASMLICTVSVSRERRSTVDASRTT